MVVEAEEREFLRAATLKQPGMRGFVGRQNPHSGSTVALYGAPGKTWTPLVVCFGEDHTERAKRFVERFNRL